MLRFGVSARVGLFSLLILLPAALASGPASARQGDRDRVIDLQVRLSWAGASPGPIDGRMGKNTEIALEAFQRMQGLEITGKPDKSTRAALGEDSEKPTIIEYEIAPADVKGPFAEKIPEKFEEQAELKRLSYTSPREALAEKFHMDEDLLRELNPGKRLDEAGTVIRVANLGDQPLEEKVDRIEVDKAVQIVRAYGRSGKLLAAYPATIGSRSTPSPEGTHKVKSVARNPTYTYDPKKLDFEEVKTDRKLTIAPGPNNPVGLVWIELDEEGYGIHGSPEPTQIRRQSSHGCVRLTNWDALQLADAVSPGVKVEFVTGEREARAD